MVATFNLGSVYIDKGVHSVNFNRDIMPYDDLNILSL